MVDSSWRDAARVLGVLSLVGLSACAGPSAGVWWVEMEVADDPDCSSFVAHNFADASVPEEPVDEDAWSRELGQQLSPAGFFALVTEDADGVLWTAGGEVLRGQRANGEWTLTGAHFETLTQDDSHPDGYVFSAVLDSQSDTEVALTQERDTLTGAMTLTSTSAADYTETDDWALDLGQASQIPVGSTLFLEDGTPASNAPDFEDCTSAPCSLSVETSCEASASMVAVRTDLDPQDYEGISEAGFDAGL